MACNTCGHTMQKLAVDPKVLFWCPRCGTLKEVAPHMGREFECSEAPKLVECVRGFVRMIDNTTAGRWLKTQAEVSGVLESTLPPGERT